jgi:transcriptional regulator with XRE-family HTH domain
LSTASVSDGEPRTERLRLAAELLRLRDQAGVSGRQLARRIGISQSKVSRIETGATIPSIPEVTAWAAAVDTSPETQDWLRTLAEAAYLEVHTWRSLLRQQPHLQDAIGHEEASAGRVRMFEPSIVPGLLQTAEYASRVFSMFQLPYSRAAAVMATAGRVNRQSVLYQGGQFEFLVAELALRWRPGPRRLLVAQLDRIAQLSAIEGVDLGVIRSDVEATTTIPHGFVIYGDGTEDRAYVAIETVHAIVRVFAPDEVEMYLQQWSQLRQMAVHGDAARRCLAELVSELTGAAP